MENLITLNNLMHFSVNAKSLLEDFPIHSIFLATLSSSDQLFTLFFLQQETMPFVIQL